MQLSSYLGRLGEPAIQLSSYPAISALSGLPSYLGAIWAIWAIQLYSYLAIQLSGRLSGYQAGYLAIQLAS